MLPNYNDFPCPVCGHKISEHTNSIFGHNPKIDTTPTGEIASECPRTYHSLVIEKLSAWWKDALSERDAYMESYADVCKERYILQKKLDVAIEGLRQMFIFSGTLYPPGSTAKEYIERVEKIK